MCPSGKSHRSNRRRQANAYSFALVACGQRLHPIVVEEDQKFMGTSLSLTTPQAGGNHNKPWNQLSRNSDESGPEHGITYIFEAVPNIR